jgi:hypothetical protein
MTRNDDLLPARVARAGQAKTVVPDHFVTEEAVIKYALAREPLNGSFENYSAGTAFPPDNWTEGSKVTTVGTGTGTWGTHFESYTASVAAGERCLRLKPGVGGAPAQLHAPTFKVSAGAYFVSYWYRVIAGVTVNPDVFTLTLVTFDASGGIVSAPSSSVTRLPGSGVTGWIRRCDIFPIVSGLGIESARLIIGKGSLDPTFDVLLDDIWLRPDQQPPEWIEPNTFFNSWTHYADPAWGRVSYLKDINSTVRLNGMLQGGTLTTTAFTLPAGYRPGSNLILPTAANNGASDILGHLRIYTNGDVRPHAGGNAWFSLHGITFKAEQ